MDDPAERFYSPPPPTGLRERLRARRRSLIATLVVVLLIGVAFGVARVVSGDGKGSGHIERAFGGYISAADQERLASITTQRNGTQMSYLHMVEAARHQNLSEIIKAAGAGGQRVSSALADAHEIENDELRTAITDLLKRQRDVFVAYVQLASYAKSHRGGAASKAKLDDLARRATDAETRARAASDAFFERISAYMTPEQREQAERAQRDWESQVKAAGG